MPEQALDGIPLDLEFGVAKMMYCIYLSRLYRSRCGAGHD